MHIHLSADKSLGRARLNLPAPRSSMNKLNSTPKPRAARVILHALVVLLPNVTACSDISFPTGALRNGDNGALPEDRGTLVHTRPGTTFRNAHWVRSGDLFLTTVASSPYTSRVEVMRVNPFSTRVVAESGDPLSLVTASNDGTAAYYVVSTLRGENRTALRQSMNGGPAELFTSAPGYVYGNLDLEGKPILSSPSDKRVAFVTFPDSLIVWTLSTGERRGLSRECNSVVAWSPDESEVLCVTRLPIGDPFIIYTIVTVSTGSSRTLDVPAEVRRFARMMRWDADGIHILGLAYGDVRLYDVTTQTSTTLHAAPVAYSDYGAYVDYGSLAWSDDGKRVAFWTFQCLDGLRLFSPCTTPQTVLLVSDLSTHTERRVAVLRASLPDKDVVLSADGTRALYTTESSLYLKSVPCPHLLCYWLTTTGTRIVVGGRPVRRKRSLRATSVTCGCSSGSAFFHLLTNCRYRAVC